MSARQKEKALGSITEVVQTIKHRQSHIQTMSHDNASKHEGLESFNLDYILPKSAEIQNMSTPGRHPQSDSRGDVSHPSSCREADTKSRKSGRISLMG
jgi:hypothetical protein